VNAALVGSRPVSCIRGRVFPLQVITLTDRYALGSNNHAHDNQKQAAQKQKQPGIERGQAVADISRSALCCHNNDTHAAIEIPPNNAQLGGPPTIPPSNIRVRAVMWACGE